MLSESSPKISDSIPPDDSPFNKSTGGKELKEKVSAAEWNQFLGWLKLVSHSSAEGERFIHPCDLLNLGMF